MSNIFTPKLTDLSILRQEVEKKLDKFQFISNFYKRFVFKF